MAQKDDAFYFMCEECGTGFMVPPITKIEGSEVLVVVGGSVLFYCTCDRPFTWKGGRRFETQDYPNVKIV